MVKTGFKEHKVGVRTGIKYGEPAGFFVLREWVGRAARRRGQRGQARELGGLDGLEDLQRARRRGWRMNERGGSNRGGVQKGKFAALIWLSAPVLCPIWLADFEFGVYLVRSQSRS